jgi:hypothetical protein
MSFYNLLHDINILFILPFIFVIWIAIIFTVDLYKEIKCKRFKLNIIKYVYFFIIIVGLTTIYTGIITSKLSDNTINRFGFIFICILLGFSFLSFIQLAVKIFRRL